MTTEVETKIIVGSISLMRRGAFEEGWNAMAPRGDLYREDEPRECDEDEVHRGLDSGKMSM